MRETRQRRIETAAMDRQFEAIVRFCAAAQAAGRIGETTNASDAYGAAWDDPGMPREEER